MERSFKLLTFIALVSLPGMALAQVPPPPPPGGFENFLDDEDFDAPPGSFNPNAGGDRKGFGPGVNSGTRSGGDAPAAPTKPSGTEKTTAQPRRLRNTDAPKNLISKRPPNMADATDKDITDENFPDLIDSFDYPNAEIGDIVKAISELTGKNFIVDSNVRGKITIIAPTRITVAEAYKAFLSALAVNGLTVVPSGKFLKIKQAGNALHDNLDTYSGSYSPNTDSMITRIVQLRYIQASEVNKSLGRILVSRNGELQPYEPTNTLIITDYGSNIERAMKILKKLDVPGFEEQLEVVRIRYAKASDIAKTLDQIINKGKNNSQGVGGGFTAGIPRFAPLGGSQSTSSDAYSMVLPDERTNSIIIVGNTSGIAKIKGLLGKLDFKVRAEDSGGVYVYYVRFGDAEKISTTLSGLAQQSAQATTAPSGPGASNTPVKATVFGGDVKITSDKTTNSLVITASKQDYEVVQNILSKLDVPRDQVYVEGIFMEMNVSNIKQWGISYYQFAGDSLAARAGFSSKTTNLSQLLNPTSDNGAVIGFGSGKTISATLPGSTTAISIPSLAGLINFLSQLTTINILSTPQIMALDNEEATIEVGKSVPVGQSSATTGSTTTISTQREDATMKLTIKPHISPGSNTMRLEIEQKSQDVTDANVPQALATVATSLNKRYNKTNVIVHDRDTIVLGGLMQDKETVNTTKVPLLGDIPIIGWLFKSKNTTLEKLNLMMFLTPKIVRNETESSDLLMKKMKERVKFIEKNAGGRDAQGDFMDQLRVERNGKVEKIEAK